MEKVLNSATIHPTIKQSSREDISSSDDPNGPVKTNSYRKIPLHKTSEVLKKESIKCENLSGVRDVKKRSISKNTISPRNQNKNIFRNKTVQLSLSEPTLIAIKDRGDAMLSHYPYTHGNSTTRSDFGVAQPRRPNCDFTEDLGSECEGCVLIRNAGKIYKSFIVPNGIKSAVRGVSGSQKTKNTGKRSFFLPEGVNFKGEFQDTFALSAMEFGQQAWGDFDIAIFLTGVNSHQNISNIHNEEEEAFRQRYRLKDKNVKRPLPFFDRSSEPAQDNYAGLGYNLNWNHPKKADNYMKRTPIINPPNTRFQSAHQLNNSELVFSSASDCESVPRSPEIFTESRKFPRKNSANNSNGIGVRPREGFHLYQRGGDSCSNKSTEASQSSLFQDFSNVGMIPNKLGDKELFDLFDSIFRRYASTNRHAGDVIPRRISTAWMINAGIVADILTENQADDAFRRAAGAKITMNSKEYKDFIIKLTQRLKLPYYELYRRMCGIEC